MTFPFDLALIHHISLSLFLSRNDAFAKKLLFVTTEHWKVVVSSFEQLVRFAYKKSMRKMIFAHYDLQKKTRKIQHGTGVQDGETIKSKTFPMCMSLSLIFFFIHY